MPGTFDILIREMVSEDYPAVFELWEGIKGFGIRSIDDSEEGIIRFLRRNPNTSAVAVQNGRIIGDILCGHDGRTGYFYHVCVDEKYRKHGIGYKMARFCMAALRKEGINKISLIASKSNMVGNAFWQGWGWQGREDVNLYEIVLNEENVTKFVL